MKTILITGGCGFIAKGLLKKLYDNDTQIICVDNFISSSENAFNSFLQKNKLLNIIYNNIDICNKDDLQRFLTFLNIKNINEVYHLASIASPPLYKKFPLETLDVAYIGTKNVLEICKKYNSKILFTSTSEVYGDPSVNPQSETYYGNVNSFGVRSSYDCGKRVAEALCFSYIHEYNIDVKIARIFNTYGPEMDINDGRIITETIKHLINNSTLTIYGDGNQTRSICFIKDTVDMLVDLMSSKSNIPVNIGNDYELTINQIINQIEIIYGKTVKKTFKPLTENDPMIRKPCLKLNESLLGKRVFVSLKDGITQTINQNI